MKVIIANKFKDKLLGLMFKKNIDYALLIKECKSIHTFNMLENIDILLLHNNRVLEIRRNIKPNKILIFHSKYNTDILEMPYNSSKNIKINDILDLNNLKIENY